MRTFVFCLYDFPIIFFHHSVSMITWFNHFKVPPTNAKVCALAAFVNNAFAIYLCLTLAWHKSVTWGTHQPTYLATYILISVCPHRDPRVDIITHSSLSWGLLCRAQLASQKREKHKNNNTAKSLLWSTSKRWSFRSTASFPFISAFSPLITEFSSSVSSIRVCSSVGGSSDASFDADSASTSAVK